MKLLTHIPAWLRNKYFIATAAFLAWMVFFDRNDLATQLQTNPATLEKYAREKYYMKRDNEDLFIITPESKKAGN